MARPRSTRRPKLLERIRHGDSYVLVLALIVGDYLVLSLSDKTAPLWGVAAVLVTGATLLAAMRTSRVGTAVMRAGMVAALLALLLAALNTALDARAITTLIGVAIGGLLLAAPVAILWRIARHPAVTIETLAGAIDVYLLLGLTFASLYAAVDTAQPPFFAQSAHAAGNDFLYFSYVTLATLGYGDLTPATTVGRTLAVIEAMSGQVYLVTVVAGLVALLVRKSERG